MVKYRNVLQKIIDNLTEVPFFKLQQIIYEDKGIHIIEETGLTIHLGNEQDLKNKFLMLKYFIGANRHNLNQMQLIDIQFPKRVIIK